MEEPIAKNIFAVGSVINLENFNQRIPVYKFNYNIIDLYRFPWYLRPIVLNLDLRR
jgi:hypothetical protein